MKDEEQAEMTVDSVGLEEAAPSEEKDPVETADVEPDPVEPEQGEAQENEPESKSEGEEEPEPDKAKKTGFQKRINKLTLRQKEAERRADALELENQELKGRNQVEQDNQTEPLIDDFDDYSAYEKALVDFKANEKFKKYRDDESVKKQEIKAQDVQRTFNERVEKANIDGFKEASAALIESRTLPGNLVNVLLEHEKGPELVHYLGSHLDFADSLNNLSPQRALLKLGELSVNLLNVKKTKRITKAPDPMKVLTGGSSIRSQDGDLSMEEYYKKYG